MGDQAPTHTSPGAVADAERGHSVRAFLIADVRGYTRFTEERGDDAAARLVRRFAELVQEGVERRGGSLIELRGDEALAVFTLVNALTVNLPDITAVQILIDGKEVDTLAGHVDLRRPLVQNLTWVE